MAKFLDLPTFRRSRCVLINICGSIETKNKELLKILGPKRNSLIASYTTTIKSEAYLAIVTGGERKTDGEDSKKHFHIDVFKKLLTGKNRAPSATSTLEEIEERFRQFAGLEVEASVLGMFEVPVSELPEDGIIRSNMFETEADNLRIKTTGTKFQIEGAPIAQVAWSTNYKGDKMMIQMESFIKADINKNLVMSVYDTMNQFFKAFVMEDK